MTTKEEYLYPVTIKIDQTISEKIYFLSLPSTLKLELIKLEQLSNIKFNPQFHSLPTNSLKKMFITHLKGITDIKKVTKTSDDTKWLTSFTPIDINKVIRILDVWIEVFYIDESELEKKRHNSYETKELAKQLCSQLCTSLFNITEENVRLFNNGQSVDSMAYTILPLKIVDSLAGKKINFMNQEVEVLYSANNELVTNPIAFTDKKGVDYHSYVMQFSIQTIPPLNEAYLNIKFSIRRWISRNDEEKIPYLPTIKATYVKVGPYKLQRLDARYSSNFKEVTWKNADYKSFVSCYGEDLLPSFNSVIINPQNYISNDQMAIYIPFEYGITGIKHNTDAGLPFNDIKCLFKLIKEQLTFISDNKTSKAVKVVGSNKPTPFFDEKFLLKNAPAFHCAVGGALNEENVSIEIWYSSGEEQVRDALLQKLQNHFDGTGYSIASYNLEDLGSPLIVDNDKVKINLKGFEKRVAEIQNKISVTKGPTLCFIVLENKDAFCTNKGKEDLYDPKNALRIGFAKCGRLTQFITPKNYYEIDGKNNQKILSYKKALSEFEEGEREKKPKALGKNYYVNTVIQHTILDGYRQLGIVCNLSKNKSIMEQKVTGIYICNYKNTIYGKTIQPFPIFITCDFVKGYISGYCDLIENVDIPYWKLSLGLVNQLYTSPDKTRNLKSSNTVISRRLLRIMSLQGPHLVVVVADGTSRRLIKGISNTEIEKAFDPNRGQISNFLVNEELNGQIQLDNNVKNLSLVRLRVNDEVPEYYPTTSDTNISKYKSMAGIFKYNDVYYSLDDKSSKEKDTLDKEHSKIDKEQYYSHRNLVEMYPLFMSDRSEVNEIKIIKCIHDLRIASIQHTSGKTTLPLPLHLAKKLEEYII
ncbi:MAG: pPIWI_RE module domain-containing protein [Cellulosilyticaceae bacterium]